jgi:cytoplasmic tRNA 2-thiolation protein 1
VQFGACTYFLHRPTLTKPIPHPGCSYGLELFLLSIDEGISGYRDDSLETVKRNQVQYDVPLHVFSYKDLYGWTMDEIVGQVGTKNNCTFCGVFRRQVSCRIFHVSTRTTCHAHCSFFPLLNTPSSHHFRANLTSPFLYCLQALDRGATLVNADKVATGHNADDVAETVLLNILRADVPRLGRCTSATTGEEGRLPRVKPFKYTYEKEIVMYAYFKGLDYFSTECVYSPFAARGATRELVKDLEAARPSAILDIIRSGERFRVAGVGMEVPPPPGTCQRCGYMSSQPVCKACLLLEGLNRGMPQLGIRNSKQGNKMRRNAETMGQPGGQGRSGDNTQQQQQQQQQQQRQPGHKAQGRHHPDDW